VCVEEPDEEEAAAVSLEKAGRKRVTQPHTRRAVGGGDEHEAEFVDGPIPTAEASMADADDNLGRIQRSDGLSAVSSTLPLSCLLSSSPSASILGAYWLRVWVYRLELITGNHNAYSLYIT
jgi:hypothetical protein